MRINTERRQKLNASVGSPRVIMRPFLWRCSYLTDDTPPSKDLSYSFYNTPICIIALYIWHQIKNKKEIRKENFTYYKYEKLLFHVCFKVPYSVIIITDTSERRKVPFTKCNPCYCRVRMRHERPLVIITLAHCKSNLPGPLNSLYQL